MACSLLVGFPPPPSLSLILCSYARTLHSCYRFRFALLLDYDTICLIMLKILLCVRYGIRYTIHYTLFSLYDSVFFFDPLGRSLVS
ncbi:hypothetical protein GYMLUDRAFT_45623 [Collybiopsis luxurians FD-317 M1]|uniref:Uncharacterized protein n=1 Tax=Collybiopsis luxurians FD-317 M1 TaxID=944289 RepID=A0A0D0BS25_9AGAR|nr:hypothetical protein GYMLUDRAFT_45623 [Collybiopsis luxurians FD-317 M1]